jgi:hypothetical protein
VIRDQVSGIRKQVPTVSNHSSGVMAGLVPAIHVLLAEAMQDKAWMPAQASLRSLRTLGCERGHDGGSRASDP